MKTQKRSVLEKIQTYLRIQKAIEDHAKQKQRNTNRTTNQRPKEVHSSASGAPRFVRVKLSKNGIEFITANKK